MDDTVRKLIHPIPHGPFRSVASLENFAASVQQMAYDMCAQNSGWEGRPNAPPWFENLLENFILPPLTRLGFEEWFARYLFVDAASAWASMGPVNDDIVLVFPELERQINEIRSGVLFVAKKGASDSDVFGDMEIASRRASDLVDRVCPGDPVSDAKNMGPSWIILPRAYYMLGNSSSRVILFYVKVVSREKETEFIRILARIITEFLCNFVLKYMRGRINFARFTEGLFYGYAAMFWKNLLLPPHGLEDLLLFENFFRMARRIHSEMQRHSKPISMMVEQMISARERLFWELSLSPLSSIRDPYGSILLVALRHGRPGIESCVRLLGLGPRLFRGRTAAGLPYACVPFQLSLLMRESKRRWAKETKKTRESIMRLLTIIWNMYTKTGSKLGTSRILQDQLSFIGARVQALIRDFKASVTNYQVTR